MSQDITRQACNPNQSVVVEACAGSGKTWLLISRIFRLLLDGVSPEHILAITFTRKAAQEMRERLEQLLHDIAVMPDEQVIQQLTQRGLTADEASTLCQPAKQLLEKVLSHPKTIAIDTFHGWFSRLAGAAPMTSEIVSQGNLREDRKRLLNEALDSWWMALGQGQGKFKALQQHYIDLTELVSKEMAENMIQGSFSILEQQAAWQQYQKTFTPPQNPITKIKQLLPKLSNDNPFANGSDERVHDWGGLQTCYDWYSQSVAANDKELSAALEIALKCHLGKASDEDFYLAIKAALLNKTKPFAPRPNVLGCSGALVKILKTHQRLDLVEKIPQIFAGWIDKLNEYQLIANDKATLTINTAWVELGTSIAEHFSQFKKNHRFIDFNDLEMNVASLLSDEVFASYLQLRLDAKYKHILIDEFQDTNPLQWIILKSWLAAYGPGDKKPSIFIVGDPKQSIYRFRRADVRLFGEVQAYLRQHYDAVCLSKDETRRNPPEVVIALNQTFTKVKERLNPSSEIPYRFTDHQTLWQNDLDNPVVVSASCLELIGTTVRNEENFERNPLTQALSDTTITDPALRLYEEATQVAKIIRHWLSTRKVIDDGPNKLVRASKESDFYILVRSSTHLQQIEKALREEGLSYQSPRKGGLLKTLEAEDIIAILRVLLTPSNHLALAHVLRTPIFSCTEEDLQYLALNFSKHGFWQGLSEANSSLRLKHAYEVLSRWRDKVAHLPVHDLLDYIYQDGQLFEKYSKVSPPLMQPKVIANLEAFLKLALDIHGGRYPSINRFIDELMMLAGGSELETPDEGEVGGQGVDEDGAPQTEFSAVRIMTIHSAKGLEAPFVFLMNTNPRPRNQDTAGLLMDWPTQSDAPKDMLIYKATYINELIQRIKDKETKIAELENYNLLYVAMTRAKQCFVASGNGDLQSSSWYTLLNESGLKVQSLADFISEHPQEIKVPHVQQDSLPRLIYPKLPILDSPKDLTVSLDLEKGFESESVSTSSQEEYQLLGVAVHLIFERLTNQILPSQYQLPSEEQLSNWLGLPLDRTQRALKIVQNILKSPQVREYFYSTEIVSIWNEQDVLDENDQSYKIDRLVEFSSHFVILDYKLSIPNPSHPFYSKYHQQLKNYQRLVQRIRSDKPVQMYLVDQHGIVKEIV
jgi:ATP-dependent helicase/nuclease subunit A